MRSIERFYAPKDIDWLGICLSLFRNSFFQKENVYLLAVVSAIKVGAFGVDQGKDIYLDDLNQVYLTGSFQYNVNFNPLGLGLGLGTSGSQDAFIAKYRSLSSNAFGVIIMSVASSSGGSLGSRESTITEPVKEVVAYPIPSSDKITIENVEKGNIVYS